jgi:DNA-binding NarL/FixJ family response regulator
MTKRYSILIAEDHPLVRAGIRSLLMREPDLDIVGEVETGEDAVRVACASLPDVALVDLNMPGRGGLHAIAEIKRLVPSVKTMVITMHKTDEYIHEALRNGAAGYILKESGPEELIAAIRKVLSGKIYLSPDVSERFISTMVSEKQKPVITAPQAEELTSRELQVLKLVAQGEVNKQIADQLHLSIKTVEKHRSSVMRKLGLRNVAMLVTYAINEGIVTP